MTVLIFELVFVVTGMLRKNVQRAVSLHQEVCCFSSLSVFFEFLKTCVRFQIFGRILNVVYTIGLVIEEITEEVETISSANLKNSSTEYSVAQPQETRDIPKTQTAADTEVLSNNSERLQALKNDPATLRFVLFIKIRLQFECLIMIDDIFFACT